MGITRKFWIGISDENDHRPDNYETFLVFNEEELVEVQAQVAEWMADEYFNNESEGEE